MGKLILLLLIGGAIYYLFFKKPQNTVQDSDENEFVQCEKCGTFVLKKEMKMKNGKLLCKECYANS